MAFEALVITDAGRALLASAMQGGGITFTRAQMGDGQITTQTLAALTALVSPVITLPISSASHSGDTASVVVDFSNAVVDLFTGDGTTTEFTLSASPASLSGVTVGGAAAANYTYTANSGKIVFSSAPSTGAAIAVSYGVPAFSWREIGVFAADPDHPNDRAYDILYCYQNAGTAPIAIPAPDDTPYSEQITIKIHVSSVQTINVSVAPGVNAGNVAFDPTGVEGVTGTTIQAAISELATEVAGKQGKITANGVLRGDGEGNVTAKDVREIVTGGYGILSVGDPSKMVAAESDLNTESFIHVGTYICSDSSRADGLSNCPTNVAFLMHVYCPVNTNDSIGLWEQRVRKIIDLNGREFIQKVSGGATAGVYTWGAWKQISTNIPKRVTATLTVAGWSNKAQSVSVAGVTTNSIITVTYAPASRAAWIDADVYCSAQGAGTLTFACDTVPTQALTANIVILA